MSRDSGAGAYVQSAGTGMPLCFFSSSVKREVVRGLVGARLLLAELHQDVVQERRGADAIELGRQPVRSDGLVHEDEMLDRLLRGADSAGGLEADEASRLLVHVANRLEHAERDGERRRGIDLAGRRLDE